MHLSRRNFLSASAATAAALATGSLFAPKVMAEPAAKKIPLGVQLYSVRGVIAKELPEGLAKIAKMGYQGVEFAGYYSRSAEDLKKLLDDNGLVACGTHTGLGSLEGDNLKKTVEFNKTLGNKYLIVPSLGGKLFASKEAIKATGEKFNAIADQAAKSDMYVGFHAHGGEFRKIDGEFIWDLFGKATSDRVILQMDTGNCRGGGGDPIEELKKFPGRAKTVHLKAWGGKDNAVVGDDDLPWTEIFEVCKTTAGTQWYIVEQERYPKGVTPYESIEKCIANLRKMGV